MKYLIGLISLLFSFLALGQESIATGAEPLPADQAFQFSAAVRDNQTLLAQWDIAPGYYLYRDRFNFKIIKPATAKLGQPLLPPSQTKTSPETGKYQVFSNNVTIPIPILSTPSNNVVFQVTYQGCSTGGFCYPPTTKVVSLDLSGNYMNFVTGQSSGNMEIETAKPAPVVAPASRSSLDFIGNLLANKSLFTILMTFLGFGLLISLTPCVLPMIPILSGIILGQKNMTTRRAFTLSVTYVLGMAITYAIAGMLFGLLGGTLQAALQKPWLIFIFAVIYVLLALSLFGFFHLELPEKWRGYFAHISQRQQTGTYFGTALMGVFSTLILSPCVTPPLVAVLGYISHTGNAALGGAALFMTGLGMGVPLLLIGIGGAKFLPKSGPWMIAVKYILGLLLLAIAIEMLQRVVPGYVSMLLWAALMIGTGIYLDALTTTHTRWGHIRKTLGLIFFIYGIVLIIATAQGNYNLLRPLSLPQCDTDQSRVETSFQPVKTVAEVSSAIQAATAHKKIVMLDFYADWCLSCVEMDQFTFHNPEVIAALKNIVLLRANVTANNSDDKLLQQRYNVIAPPTMIFFDAQGNEIKNSRIVGKMSAADFLAHLRSLGS